MIRILLFILIAFISTGCATSPPKDIDNICNIFNEKKSWYSKTKKTHKKYGLPIQVQMAIIHQESSFRAKAKTPRKKLFGFIPLWRISSAYGYAQVKDSTWEWYKEKTGKWGADRDDFSDAVDFIGWYTDISYKTLKIPKWNARKQYLAYHEGHGGYKRKTYLKKKWLMKVAKKVAKRADRYGGQLHVCRQQLEKRWNFWPYW